MLEREESEKLIKAAQAGDEHAKTVLIRENAPLIKSIIRRYKGRGIEYDDLYQLGCIGFLKAIRNFSFAFDVKFSTYAVPMNIQCGKQSGIAVVSSNRRFWICRTTVLLGVVN